MKAAVAFSLVLCCLATNVAAWRCRPGPRLQYAQQVDAGQGQVVARDRFFSYFLVGRSWYRLSTLKFKHVTVGTAGLWASDTRNGVYKYVAGNFVQASGVKASQLDAGGDEQLVGISRRFGGSCLTSRRAASFKGGKGSLRWNPLSTRMKYISCSPRSGCWGVDKADRIFYTRNISPTTCRASGWRSVSGGLKMIEVGTEGSVFGVNRSGSLYQRVGTSPSLPMGSGWRRIPMCSTVRHVSYDLGKLWVVTSSNMIQMCTH